MTIQATNISHTVYPLMGTGYTSDDYASLNLDKNHLSSQKVSTEKDMMIYLENRRSETKSTWLVGGYLEHRAFYNSELFKVPEEEIRDIHLGIDIWGKVNSPIYAPIDGLIHSFAYNSHTLDYGYTLILSHEVEGFNFHTLYGHLSSSQYDLWKEETKIKAGTLIGHLGSKEENGGWLPHLHFQLIKDMGTFQGDYPGVCSQSNLPYYKENCLNPAQLIQY